MKKKVLVIEDDMDTLQAFYIRLKSYGLAAIGVQDGYQAIQTAQREKPDLIIIDIGLPGGDGISVIQRLKSIPHLSLTPIIVVTARSREEWETRSAEAGADAFVEKPVDEKTLFSLLKRYLSISRVEKEVAGKKRIMIVEDDADTRQALSIRIKGCGYEVVTAADSISAMTVAVNEKPDLILLDLGLPGGDGLILMNRFKKIPELAGIPVIVLSARDPQANREASMREGAFAYFQKPADNNLLLAEIKKALQ